MVQLSSNSQEYLRITSFKEILGIIEFSHTFSVMVLKIFLEMMNRYLFVQLLVFGKIKQILDF